MPWVESGTEQLWSQCLTILVYLVAKLTVIRNVYPTIRAMYKSGSSGQLQHLVIDLQGCQCPMEMPSGVQRWTCALLCTLRDAMN